MTPHATSAPPRLDNLTLSRKEGWRAFVNTGVRLQPELLTGRELDDLSDPARADYDRRRREWHANLGPIKTAQLAELHEDLWDIVDSNVQDGDKAKGAVALDAYPGLGKTTSVLAFAREFHRREIAEHGELTHDGHERWPVCRVGLTGNTSLREFNRAMLTFFAHPGAHRGSAAEFANRALDCVLACETRILIVDDLHFLRMTEKSGVEVSNHFKYIANEFPVTVIFVGVGLAARGLFTEGTSASDAVVGQTRRRTTQLGMRPFTIDTDERRREWRNILLALEQRIVLARKYPGMLADELSAYLFARSSGHIGSLMTLVNRACQRAVRTGVERIDIELLDRVKNDGAAEHSRRELSAGFEANRLTTKLSRIAG